MIYYLKEKNSYVFYDINYKFTYSSLFLVDPRWVQHFCLWFSPTRLEEHLQHGQQWIHSLLFHFLQHLLLHLPHSVPNILLQTPDHISVGEEMQVEKFMTKDAVSLISYFWKIHFNKDSNKSIFLQRLLANKIVSAVWWDISSKLHDRSTTMA